MKRFLLLLCLAVPTTVTFSQSAGFMPDVKSPNVASLGNFSAVPVSSFSGTPGISVPLFELKGHTLSFPLSLSYHPSGIKPNNRNGWTGVGWSLPIAAIYREVRGWPDEMNNDAMQQPPGYYHRRNLTEGNWYLFGEAPNLSGTDRIAHHRAMANFTDLEPDIFHFDVMGIRGTFFLDHNGVWRVQSDQYVTVELDATTPFIDPLTKYAFMNSSNLVSKSFNKFILKDGYGNIYTFGGVEATEYTSTINVGTQNVSYSVQEASGLTLQASAWHVTQIRSPNGEDVIQFQYERGPYTTNLYKYAFYNQTYKNSGCQSYGYSNWQTGGALIFPVYPKQIQFGSQKVVFDFSKSSEQNYEQNDYYLMTSPNPSDDYLTTMQDVITMSSSYVPYYTANPTLYTYYEKILWMKLDAVHFFVDGHQYRSFEFSYNNIATERLFLDKLTQLEASNSPALTYKFSYNQRNLMPKYLKNLTDHWGFDNGNTYSATFSPSGIYSQRQPNASYLTRGILSAITYPTGGKTEFGFEPGSYSKIVSKNDRTTLVSETGMGGIRVKEIRSYEKDGALLLKKEYKYTKNGVGGGTVSSGVLNNKPLYYLGTTTATDMSGGTFSFSAFKSNSVDNLSDQSGVMIGYTEVTEITHGDGEVNYATETFTNHDNGYPDSNPVSIFKADLLMNRQVSSRAFQRGRPLRTVYYNSTGGKVRSLTNAWDASVDINKSSRALQFNYMDVSVACNVEYYYPSSVAYVNYYTPVLLTRTTDSLFSGGGTSKSITDYQYNPVYKTLVKKTVYNSDASTIVSEYRYVMEFGSGQGNSYSVYDKMIFKGMLHYPVEETVRHNGNYIEAKVIEYRSFGTSFRPSLTFELTSRSPLTSYNLASPLAYTTGELSKDPSMTLQKAILTYDSYGNPTEVNERDSYKTSYLSGYNGQYLITSIKNAVQADIAYAGFESETKGNWSYSGSPAADGTAPTGDFTYSLSGGAISKSGLTAARTYLLTYWAKSASATGISGAVATAMRSKGGWTQYRRLVSGVTSVTLSGSVAVDDIRLHPVEASMDSYTYEPLVGMTTHTDPSGNVFYYEYDGSQRLKAVRDLEGHIVEDYNYNYQHQ